jgi:hypothetical protein
MGRKGWILGIGLVGLFALGAVPALSDAGSGASIARDFACYVYDGDGDLVLTSGTISVVSKNGGSTITCTASGLTNTTGRVVRFDETDATKLCNTFAGEAESWTNTVSPSGHVTLTCRVGH